MASIKEQILREEKRLKAPVLTEQGIREAIKSVMELPQIKENEANFQAWIKIQSPGFLELFDEAIKKEYAK